MLGQAKVTLFKIEPFNTILLKGKLLGASLALAAVVMFGLLVLMVPTWADTTTFTVNSTSDAEDADPFDGECRTASDECTLRAAIRESSNAAGEDTINFDIPGAGVQTITPTSALPSIISVTIDGTTQPGYSGSPIIELNGAGTGFPTSGLTMGTNSTVRGLAINRFPFAGIELMGGGNTIVGNHIGTDASGTAPLGNLTGVNARSSNNRIGGTTPADRNVISGNLDHGLVIVTSGNRVQGNYIGTDASGTQDLGNPFHGVYLRGASNNLVGGTEAGAGNVISGNDSDGVFIESGGDNQVQGNHIGTDAAGAADLGNGKGVRIRGSNNLVGGTETGARNVVSGNDSDGVYISGGSGNRVQGNYLGTDAGGTLDRGNTGRGVYILDAANNTIGGTEPGARNVVSGNNASGIQIEGVFGGSVTSGNLVQGNYVGADKNGAISLGNSSAGVLIASANNTTVGGTEIGARNVISGNAGAGVHVVLGASGNTVAGNYIGTNTAGTGGVANFGGGVYLNGAFNNTVGGLTTTPGTAPGNLISGNHASSADGVGIDGASGNKVLGNLIGPDKDAAGAVGNADGGVDIFNGAANNSIGGTETGAANVIAFNGTDGVRISHPAGTGNAVLSNSIFSNGGTSATDLGIDLDPDGVTANDAAADKDSDSGPNNLQNFPVLNSIGTNFAGTTTIEGELDSAADTTFTVQFFSSPETDPSDHGEGKKYLGQQTDVTTDAGGNATFTFTTSAEVSASEFVTATATSPGNDTSEFSKAIIANRAPNAVNDTATTNEDTAVSTDVLANDHDPDNEALTVIGVSDPTNGAAAISGDGKSVTYTPDKDYNDSANPDSFTYTVSDGEDLTDTATVEVTVRAVNDPPGFDLPADPDQTVDEDAGAQTVGDFATNVSAGPTDESGQSVSFDVISNNGSLFSAQPAISSGGTLTYAPAKDASGSATVTVTARDDGGTADGGSDTSVRRSFTITVTPVNDAPVAGDDSYATDEDQALAIAAPGVLQNDSDVVEGALLKAAKVAGPSNGTLTLEENGSFEYRPDADFHGADAFTYKACDGPDSCSAPATVSITVNSLNEPPTISDIGDRTITQNTDTGEIPFTINDDETAASNLTVSASSGNRTLVPNSSIVLGGSGENRTVKVTPVKNRFGRVNITIRVSDGEAEAVETFTLTVLRDLTPPTITVSPPDGATRVPKTANISATFSEKIEESTLTIEVVKNGKKDTTTPVAGTSSYDPETNTLTFDPDNLLKGTYQATVRVEDEAFNPAEKIWSFTTGKK